MRQFDMVLLWGIPNYVDISRYDSMPDRYEDISGIDLNGTGYSDIAKLSASLSGLLTFLGEGAFYDPEEKLSPKFFFKWAMQRLRLMCCLEIAFGPRISGGGVTAQKFLGQPTSINSNSRTYDPVDMDYIYFPGTFGTFTAAYLTRAGMAQQWLDWQQSGFQFIGHNDTATGTDTQPLEVYLYGISSNNTTFQDVYPTTHWKYGDNKLTFLKTMTLHRNNATFRIEEYDDPTFQAYYPQELYDAGCAQTPDTSTSFFNARCDIMLIPPFEQAGDLEDYPTFAECNQ